jgi:hypothetical protein
MTWNKDWWIYIVFLGAIVLAILSVLLVK